MVERIRPGERKSETMSPTTQTNDLAIFGFCELWGLVFALPPGDALYRGEPLTMRMGVFLAIGSIFAIVGPTWPWIKTNFPRRLSVSISRTASDFRYWLGALALLFAFVIGPDLYQEAVSRGSTPASSAAATAQEIEQATKPIQDKLEAANAEFEKNKNELRQSLSAANATINDLRSQLDTAKRARDVMSQQRDTAIQQRDAANQQLASKGASSAAQPPSPPAQPSQLSKEDVAARADILNSANSQLTSISTIVDEGNSLIADWPTKVKENVSLFAQQLINLQRKYDGAIRALVNMQSAYNGGYADIFSEISYASLENKTYLSLDAFYHAVAALPAPLSDDYETPLRPYANAVKRALDADRGAIDATQKTVASKLGRVPNVTSK